MANYRPKRTRLIDVANATGYSVNTISRALRGLPDISEETRRIIFEAARNMGYVTNAQASCLRYGYTQTIAVITPDISNLFFCYILEDIENQVRESGYSTIFLSTSEDNQQEYEALRTAISKNVDGIIWCPTQGNVKNAELLISSGVPFVLLGRNISGIEADCVIPDDQKGGYQAVQYLIKKGHRNIIHVVPPKSNASSYERRLGFLKAYDEAGLPCQPDLFCEAPVIGQGFRGLLGSTLDRRKDVTAVIAFNDMIAWSVYDFLIYRGYRVPDDMSIIGFDNLQSRFFSPISLTSIAVNKRQLAATAVELLLKRMRDDSHQKNCVQNVQTTWVYEGQTVKDLIR